MRSHCLLAVASLLLVANTSAADLQEYDSRGAWHWGSSDIGAFSFTPSHDLEAAFGGACYKSNPTECLYVYTPEFTCKKNQEYSMTFFFGTPEQAKERLKEVQASTPLAQKYGKNHNIVRGICVAIGEESLSIVTEMIGSDHPLDMKVNDMLHARLVRRNTVSITATSLSAGMHSNSFSLDGSAKAARYLSHKDTEYMHEYLVSLMSNE